ncbi:hypothetical protein [Ralstonia solanacearum]|uniref:hypothetical protein n=1 Tax=Ralstonia solanacearum TaxID=305 RepID=UPI0012D3BEFF|nr:hypothetical protein [Ralstonia solanacearum]MDC6180282.1 hypothetical protein [Ralstonia solanacearum]MDC6212822.1 hypothetical protein [Ralstonia solanacearum]MDC6241676.1 hypothetical protein [Ralstonia solanacearum]MDD7803470.1 hypothetical protein [Ralstonia solanacearum]
MSKRFSIWIAFFLGLALIGWLSLRGYDSIPEKRAAIMTMLQAMSPARDAAERCWLDKRTSLTSCSETKNFISTLKTRDTEYFLAGENIIMAINYQRRVSVIIVAKPDDRRLIWFCYGFPRDMAPKQCGG